MAAKNQVTDPALRSALGQYMLDDIDLIRNNAELLYQQLRRIEHDISKLEGQPEAVCQSREREVGTQCDRAIKPIERLRSAILTMKYGPPPGK